MLNIWTKNSEQMETKVDETLADRVLQVLGVNAKNSNLATKKLSILIVEVAILFGGDNAYVWVPCGGYFGRPGIVLFVRSSLAFLNWFKKCHMLITTFPRVSTEFLSPCPWGVLTFCAGGWWSRGPPPGRSPWRACRAPARPPRTPRGRRGWTPAGRGAPGSPAPAGGRKPSYGLLLVKWGNYSSG